MVKKLLAIFLLLIILTACKSSKPIEDDNLTADINDNFSYNKCCDNKSIHKEITDETVIDVFTNNYGEVITKIYKVNNKNKAADKENSRLLQFLSKYNQNKCINWIADALKHYNINDNIADTYIQYNDIYLYEPAVLHIGLICGNIDVINLLIDFGADIHTEDNSGESILMLAEKLDNQEIIEIIIKEYENGF